MASEIAISPTDAAAQVVHRAARASASDVALIADARDSPTAVTRPLQ